MIADDRIFLTKVMATLRGLTDDEPCGGYMDLYRAVLNGKLPTQQRGRQHDISREDLHIAAKIVGVRITADSVVAAE